MSENEPLEASTHETYLGEITSILRDVLREIKGLRKDIGELSNEISKMGS